MINYEKKFPDLGQFFGGYFHQDWGYDYNWQGKEPNFEDVVKVYKAEDTPQGVERTIAELEELLSLPLETDELRRIVIEEFGSFYLARKRGFTTHEFLLAVLKILKEPNSNFKLLQRSA